LFKGEIMRDHLLDLVQHSIDLGCIDMLKIEGTDTETKIIGVGNDQSVVIDGVFHHPIAEFVGSFGMPNLPKLKTILNLDEYKQDANLTMSRNNSGELDGIEFANKSGDFRNTYRFMVANVVANKVPTPKFRGANWHVEFQPSAANIQRLKWQMSANAEEPNFQTKVENGDLKFSFGAAATHAGNFVFQSAVTGTLKRSWNYPAAQIASILGSSGNKTMKLSDDGAMQITVDSGLAVYNYIIPAQTK
jgi:hypothetical protein